MNAKATLDESAPAPADRQARPLASGGQGGWWQLAGLAASVAILAVVSRFVPAGQHFQKTLDWTREQGVWGPVVVVLVYVVACVLFLPGSVLTLGAGAIFGPLLGTVTVSIGSTLGACAAFLVGRFLARGWIAAKVAKNPKFAAVDAAVGRHGFKIVLLTRLSPLFPFNLLNYALGLTKVSFPSYALASWVGMLPGTVMYVYLGHAAGSLAAAADGQPRAPQEWIMLVGSVLIAIVVVTFIASAARSALRGTAANGVEAAGQSRAGLEDSRHD